uniref:Ubiquitin-conjugating enzyme E2Q-like protein 1 n=1 Tax=Equus asinus TaxID=9793 RepID=A0A9L0K6U5_EQUAS
MKELQDIARLSDRFISVELVDESLFDWNVKLHQVDKDSVLWQDMKETNTEFILLNLTFPDNFPFSPPFMRVLSPRLENGYVLDGGAICMELLTPRGWSSAYTVEAVMRQFAASLVKGQKYYILIVQNSWSIRMCKVENEVLQDSTCQRGASVEKPANQKNPSVARKLKRPLRVW